MVFVSQYLIVAVVALFEVCNQVLAIPKIQTPKYDIEFAEEHFKEFMVTFNKQYETPEEMQRRLHIFTENLKKINVMNAESNETAVFGINQFADLEHAEFRKNVLCLQMQSLEGLCPQALTEFTMTDTATLEDLFDWRQSNVVTRVKNQGQCGSCWTFAAIGNIESQYALKHRRLEEFSEQQMLDCDAVGSCRGGNIEHGIATLQKQGGVVGETDYPYVASKGQCRFNPGMVKAKVTSCYTIRYRSEEELKKILRQTGPLAIGLDASDFHLYRGGVLPRCTAGILNHAVLLTGYGVDPRAGPYWIIKNSYSEHFGENGYIKIRRNVNACNIIAGHAVTSTVA